MQDVYHNKFIDQIFKEQNYNRLTEKDYYQYLCQRQKYDKKYNHFCLKESDFYPPLDDRVLESYVEDIDDGDNFAGYSEYIFNYLKSEGYYD